MDRACEKYKTPLGTTDTPMSCEGHRVASVSSSEGELLALYHSERQ